MFYMCLSELKNLSLLTQNQHYNIGYFCKPNYFEFKKSVNHQNCTFLLSTNFIFDPLAYYTK